MGSATAEGARISVLQDMGLGAMVPAQKPAGSELQHLRRRLGQNVSQVWAGPRLPVRAVTETSGTTTEYKSHMQSGQSKPPEDRSVQAVGRRESLRSTLFSVHERLESWAARCRASSPIAAALVPVSSQRSVAMNPGHPYHSFSYTWFL